MTAPDTVDQLPERAHTQRPRWWWLGTHGGAGESVLARLCDGTAAAGHCWPITEPAASVVLVCRQSGDGLRAAQRAARQWAAGAGRLGPITVLGLVVMAAAPGKVPKQVRELQTVVAGSVARVWTVGWQRQWWTDVNTDHAPPAAVRRLADDIDAVLTEGG